MMDNIYQGNLRDKIRNAYLLFYDREVPYVENESNQKKKKSEDSIDKMEE